MSLPERLRARLEEGPMRLRDWMEACLYDPQEGYYMRAGRKTGPGQDADYATSPTLHPFLAQAVAEEVAACWDRLGHPASFEVVEFGGGEGDLARDALAHLDLEHPVLGGRVAWIHVERSPGHREAQATDDPRLRWAEGMPAVEAGFVVAHEFLDALPFHVLERRLGDWAEVFVRLEAGAPVASYGIPAPVAIEATPGTPAGGWPDKQRVAAMAEARAWLREVAERLQRGGVLVVDYGDEAPWRHGPHGTVRAFAGHRDAGDPLDDPGEKDITASVDFACTRRWGEAAGLQEALCVSQEEWLLGHGILEALNGTDRSTQEGASRYLRLRQLLLPTGLGQAFRVQRFDKGA